MFKGLSEAKPLLLVKLFAKDWQKAFKGELI